MFRSLPVRALVLVFLVAGCSAAAADEAARIVEVLGLEPGMAVADVGAGEGEWSLVLSRGVGAAGTVYATEVEEDLVENLGKLDLGSPAGTILAVRGGTLSTGLEPGCCDAILLRMVYHHFTAPAAMRASLRASLRPGGRIAVIDIVPQTGWRQLDAVPDRGGHGIPLDDLVTEMVGDGFVLEAAYPDWRSDDEDRYCVVFTVPAGAE